MRHTLAWSLASAVAVACALPKIEIDPSLAPDAGASGGTGGATGGTGGTGAAGKGALSGKGGAGPLSGGGQGGATDDPRELACGDYCTTYLKNCHDSPANDYANLDDCLNTCFGSDWPFGTDDAQPNSVQCRVLHAHLARDLPNPHCFHSARVPSGTSCALPP